MKYIKTFESFSSEESNESIKDWFSGKSAYNETIEFLESGSAEAEEVLKIYKEIKDSGKGERDPENLERMQRISSLGAKWAKANEMEPGFYLYSQVKTVLEKDFDRYFHGGPELPGTKGPYH